MSNTTQFEIARVLRERDQTASMEPLFPKPLERAMLGLCAAIAATVGLLCVLQPLQQLAWLGAALFLPAVLLALRYSKPVHEAPRLSRLSLGRTLIGVGVLILLPLLLRLLEGLGWIDIVGTRRTTGVMLGAALVVVGSALPGRLKPFACQRFEEALSIKLVRVVGAGFVLAGGFYALIWLAAPVAVANLWASVVLATMAVLIGLRALLMVNLHRS